MKLLWFLYGIALGLVLGGFAVYYEQTHKPNVVQITEQIVLTVPEDQKDVEKQLLYLAASKGMLEEIHRLKVLSEKETQEKKANTPNKSGRR